MIFIAGHFYLFNRYDVPDFKLDEVDWEKKKPNQKVHEQYLKLLIRGVHVITGQYATSQSDPVILAALCFESYLRSAFEGGPIV